MRLLATFLAGRYPHSDMAFVRVRCHCYQDRRRQCYNITVCPSHVPRRDQGPLHVRDISPICRMRLHFARRNLPQAAARLHAYPSGFK